jgi:alcohol dehydrogenase
MKAWQLERLGGALELRDIATPEVRRDSVLVRIETSVLMSYFKDYIDGKLPIYNPPRGWFTPGGNGVGVVQAVGDDVVHVRPGQRVLISSYLVANENVHEPAEFRLGVTAMGPRAKALQENWRDGTLAQFALTPKSSVTPIEALDALDATQLAALIRFAIPYGRLLRGRFTAGENIIVIGATSAYGSAAVLLTLALGASRVVAAGRNKAVLGALAELGGRRVTPVILTGDIKDDVVHCAQPRTEARQSPSIWLARRWPVCGAYGEGAASC